MVTVRHFDDTILTRMRTTQDSAMQDRCYVLAYTASPDTWGNPTPTYTAGNLLYCGLHLVRPTEKQASGDVPVIDAKLRLPIDTVIDVKDRIAIHTRYGEELDDLQVFEIQGPVERGPSGLVLKLQIVDDGTGDDIG